MSCPLRNLARISADDSLREVAFSEMTLGRLLLAAEFQILVVSTMVFAFYSTDTKTAVGPRRSSSSKRASSFRGLRLSFYDFGPGLLDPNRTSRTQSRPPSGQTISSWLGGGVRSRPPSQFDPRNEKSERGPDAYRSEKAILAVTGDMISDSEQSRRWDGPVYPNSVVNSFVAYPLAPAIFEGPSSSALFGQLSVGSAYDARKVSSPSVLGEAAMAGLPDSPVLGSDDISSTRKSTRSPPPRQQLSNASFLSSGASEYENLLREQIELERSIAALRKSAPLGRRSEEQVGRDMNSDLPERSTVSESSTTGNGRTSASGKSDFSLSVFPEPPQRQQFEEDHRDSRQSSSSSLLPPRLSIQGFPSSNRGSVDSTTVVFGIRTASIGTRYDVTSFIGGVPPSFHEIFASKSVSIDLSSPEGSLIQTQAQPWISDTESDPGSAIQATIVTVERTTSNVSRPRLVRSPSLAMRTSTSAISRGGGLDRPSVREAATDTPPSKQFSTLTVPPLQAKYTPGGETQLSDLNSSTKRVVGLPTRPKMTISLSADRLIGDVVATPVSGPVPVVTEGS